MLQEAENNTDWEQRRQAMARQQKALRKSFLKQQEGTRKNTLMHMRSWRKGIEDYIKSASGWDKVHLPQLLAAFNDKYAALENGFQSYLQSAQSKAYTSGSDSVDAILRSAEVNAGLPMISETLLTTLSGHSTALITNMSDELRDRIRQEISVSVLGGFNQYETAMRIDDIMGTKREGGFTWRAERIARTETNRAYSLANQMRLEQAGEIIPGLKKQWVTGINPRDTHAAANGQVVDFDEPYSLGGYKVMEPHDPSLPPEEVCNCNCVSIPVVPEEVLANPEGTDVGITGEPQPVAPPPEETETPGPAGMIGQVPEFATADDIVKYKGLAHAWEDKEAFDKLVDERIAKIKSPRIKSDVSKIMKTEAWRVLEGDTTEQFINQVVDGTLRANVKANFDSLEGILTFNKRYNFAFLSDTAGTTWHEGMHGKFNNRSFFTLPGRRIMKYENRAGSALDSRITPRVKNAYTGYLKRESDRFGYIVARCEAAGDTNSAHEYRLYKNIIDGQLASEKLDWARASMMPESQFVALRNSGVFSAYGVSSPSEFVAECAKAMVTNPEGFKRVCPEGYDLLMTYYKEEKGLTEERVLELLKKNKKELGL